MAAVAIIASMVVASLVILSGLAQEGSPATVDLGTADPFAILAGSAVTNTGPSVINGNIGVHPGTSVTGFESATVNGEIHIADAVAEQAKEHLTDAYNDAAGRPSGETLGTELGGEILTPGVYDSETGTFGLTGALTLDAEGNESAVWIFQMASTLTTAVDSSVVLANGAQACNVFWQVGTSATLGTGTSFKGNIMANAAITMNNGATLDGRALARVEAVTLINNVITIAECAPVDEPPGDDPPGDDPPGDDPPGDDPPGDDPPGDDPPGDDPPGDDPGDVPGDDPPGDDPGDVPGDDPSGDEPGDGPSGSCSTGLSASANKDTSITLMWNPIAGAEQHRIHRAVGAGAFVVIGEVDGEVASFVDTDTQVGDTHHYEVRPVIAGVEGEGCDVVEVTVIPFFSSLLTGALALIGGVAAYALGRRRT